MIVDKLGFYKARNGEYFKAVHIRNRDVYQGEFPVICIRIKYDEDYSFSEEGKYLETNEHAWDLVEYIGPELPKKPRKFEFEAYLNEWPEIKKEEGTYSMQNLVGHAIGNFLTKKGMEIFKYQSDKISKWKIIAEELPNEI